MTLELFEKKIKEEKLEKIFDNGGWKYYQKLTELSPFGLLNRFGIYHNNDENCYVLYITEDERGGIPYFTSKLDTIEAACDKLYRYISLCDKSYKEKHPDYNSK